MQQHHSLPPQTLVNPRRARKNITRACEACRRRRTKCNGGRPSCSRCTEHNTLCVYGAEEDGRKPASKFYVDLLRGRIRQLEQLLRSNSIDIETGIASLGTNSGERGPLGGPGLQAPSTDVFDLQELYLAFEGALSTDDSLNFEQDGEIRYFGPTSGRLELKAKDELSPQELHLDHGNPSGVYASAAAAAASRGTRAELYSRMMTADDEGDIPEALKEHLMELFFTWQNPWCLAVDETLFRESRDVGGAYYSPLLECCILAFGSRFTDTPGVRSDPDDPETAGRLLFEKAESFLYFDLKWPNLTTIQSLLLMSSLHVSFGSDAGGWMCQGMAYRLAMDMGLNLDAASLSGSDLISPREVELRRKIYWALYCDDKLASAYAGRVCTLLDIQGSVNIPVIPQSAETDLVNDEMQGATPPFLAQSTRDRDSAVLFRSLICLSQILEKILLSLYAPKPLCRGKQLVTFYKSCSLELKNWLYDLPSELRVDRAQSRQGIPQAYTLLMVYYTAWIILAKPFLPRSEVGEAGARPRGDRSETQHNITAEARETLGRSARQICAIAKKYQRVFGGFRLSALTATHCTLTAAVVLLRLEAEAMSSSSTRQITDLHLCLKVLEELSVSWQPAAKIRDNLSQIMIARRYPMPQDHLVGDQAADEDVAEAPALYETTSYGSFGDPTSFPVSGQLDDFTSILNPPDHGALSHSNWETFGFGFLMDSLSGEYDSVDTTPFTVL